MKRSNLWVRLAAMLCLISMLFGLVACVKHYDPPVIQNVPEQVEAKEGSDMSAALLDGVIAVGGEDRPEETFACTVTIYDEQGAAVTDCVPGTYRAVYLCDDGVGNVVEAETTLEVIPLDTEPPVISGTKDLEALVGATVSYRDGVTVTDNMDASVQLQIDSAQVNLAAAGTYPVVYSAVDSEGNRAEVTITVTVTEPAPEPEPPAQEEPKEPAIAIPANLTREDIDKLADQVLAKIIKDDMTMRQKVRAVYKHVFKNIKYVGSSDKSDWLIGAYTGFIYGRGDCFNYYSCGKALLERLGIPTVDVQRVGGTSRHYWLLIDFGEGWLHFDACWHPAGYHIDSWMLTEAEVRAYTQKVSHIRKNYFVYDYDNCPVIAVGTPEDEAEARRQMWAERDAAAAGGTVTETPADPAVTDPNAPAAGTVETVIPADQAQTPAAPAAGAADNTPVAEGE